MRFAAAVCLGVAITLSAAAAPSAQIATGRVYLQFHTPARLPGATLAPGMYLFVLGQSVGGQVVIDVYSADGSRLVATCLAVESALPRPSASTTLDYPGTSPATLRAWYPAARQRGVEFVYSVTEARDLFARTGVPVPHAPFQAGNRELVGAFPVGRTAAVPMMRISGAAAVAPAATGTSGMAVLVQPFDNALEPHQHLTAARRIVAQRAARVSEPERPTLHVMNRLLAELHSAYSGGHEKTVRERIGTIEASLTNLMRDPRDFENQRVEPLPRETALVLERVRAHVLAFARALPPPSHR